LVRWLGVNGEAIYGSKPWKYQNDTVTPNVWYTKSSVNYQLRRIIYAIVLDYPIKSNTVKLYAPASIVRSHSKIELLGFNGAVKV
jgi:alpha-L-fucosidase